MQVSVSVTAETLTLGDVRRLFRETAGWSGDCLVELLNGGRSRITVIERDEDRQAESSTAATE